MSEKIKITIKGLREDLANGITRCKGDTGYTPEKGSIEEKYGLSKSDIKEIFKDPKLVGIKVRVTKEKKWELIDDVEDSPASAPYVSPSASSIKRMSESEALVEEVEMNDIQEEVSEEDERDLPF